MMKNFGRFYFLFLALFLTAASNERDVRGQINQHVSTSEQKYPHRFAQANKPSPELGEAIENALSYLENNRTYKLRSRHDLAFRALWIQTINHLRHASFTFEREAADYTHRDLFTGQYPLLPVLDALEKASNFFRYMESPEEATSTVDKIEANPSLEKHLMSIQQKNAKEVTENPLEKYFEYRNRLVTEGPNAKFKNEFESMVDVLLLKIRSDAEIYEWVGRNKLLREMRIDAIASLNSVRQRDCPYLETIESVERALEFLDVYHRAKDPARSPVLYHSGRYEYYLHFLKGSIPDHILIPSLASLGATDLLKIRGVPIGFAGVNTDIAYVDGYYQTPYEFYIHDINHTRRMFLFFEKAAKKYGLSFEEMARASNKFITETLIPMLSINPSESREIKNRKRLMKILFFEVLHEDALAAMPEIIEQAILRKAGVRTPFERMEKGKKVVYVMETGATTLAYVFRKLAHDFYDRPGDRLNFIVEPEFRTYEHILAASVQLFEGLGLKPDSKVLDALLKDDTGMPKDFLSTLLRDNLKRPNATVPLISSDRALKLAKDEFQKHHVDASLIDLTKEPEIINFFRDPHRINVQMRVYVRDERGSIEVLIPVPEELYGVNPSVGTAEQIRGERRIIEIASGPYLDIDSLSRGLLSRLSPKNYLIVFRSDDPQIAKLLHATKEANLESLLLTDISMPRLETNVSPTYFATLPHKSAVGRFWNKLMEPLKNQNTQGGMRINFQEPTKLSYAEMFAQLETPRIKLHSSIRESLVAKGIGHIELAEFNARTGKGLKPVAFISGPTKDTQNIQSVVERTLDGLDSQRVVIITSEGALDSMVQHTAQARGFKVLALLSEGADIEKLGPATHASVVSRDLHGMARQTLDFVKKNNGSAVFLSDDSISKKEIELAKALETSYFEIASTKKFVTINPNINFSSGDELLGLMFEKSNDSVKSNYQKSARDMLFQRYAREIRRRGTQIMAYEELVKKTRGKKSVVLNGYVGLGYEYPEKVRAAVRELMIQKGDGVEYVGVGTHSGIGHAYNWIPEIAKELNFKNIQTSAIVSRNVAGLNLAPLNSVVFVDTEVGDWRPIVNGVDLQLQFLKDTGGEMVAFSGGEITGKVLLTTLQAGLPVTIFTGKDFAPNSERVKEVRARRLDAVIDGTEFLVKERKKYKTLKVLRSIENQRTCRSLFGN